MNVVKTSAQTMDLVCSIGLAKSKMPLFSNLVLAFFAGAYIGFGSLFALRVAGGMPAETWGSIQRLVFGGVFPCGLLLVLLAGADLFTGDCMFLPGGMLKHKVGIDKFFRILVLAWIGNLVGSIFVMYLAHLSGLMSDQGTAKYAVSVANGKVQLSFGVAFVRGILCNWLVCLAIYLSLTSSDGVSKAVLLWPPITAFVALGFEHSVANMSFIPLGIFIGNSDSYAQLVLNGAAPLVASWSGFFINNLIPVTLGNFVGGAFFVGILYWFANELKPEPKV
jgi:formate/nitrite transporter